jgi:uncharacterized SAM-binding protein YcdF (DUF218 family)
MVPMNEPTPRSPGDALRDPAVRESLLVSLVMLALSAGMILALSWLWVLRWMLANDVTPGQGMVLVCGHQLIDGKPSGDYVVRLKRAGELVDAQPGLRLTLLGGGQPSEAAAGRDWLIEQAGLDPARIELEEQSTDSLQNLRQARELIHDDVPVYLLSSRYHLGRLRVFARQLGMNLTLIPAERRCRLDWINLRHSMREAAYVCWFVCGRFWARLARREHMLRRIR